MSRYAIVEAPSVLGLFPKGVETLPDALLGAGLAERIGARRTVRVEPPAYDPRRDPETRLLNPHGLADYAVTLADRLEPLLEAGEFPVVLGGDCSILLGCTLANRRRGRAGLLFLDGHADFYQPEAEPNGEAASMDLALVTGRGPDLVTNIEGRYPLVREEDVILLAHRDSEDAASHGSQRVEDTNIGVINLHALRECGAAATARRALQRLTTADLDGFWIHLDADVLDDAIMPAVDYRMPGGLQWDELTTVLRTALASGKALGIDITIFNPKLDPDGSITQRFAQALAEGLAQDRATSG